MKVVEREINNCIYRFGSWLARGQPCKFSDYSGGVKNACKVARPFYFKAILYCDGKFFEIRRCIVEFFKFMTNEQYKSVIEYLLTQFSIPLTSGRFKVFVYAFFDGKIIANTVVT